MPKQQKTSTKKESKIFIISLIAILAIALVGINLDKLTGKATYPSFNAQTTISLPMNEKFINAGEYLHITVNPGPKCVNRIIGIYDDADFRRATVQPAASQFGSNNKLCNTFTVKFKTYADWAPENDETGIFFIKVFDYQSEKFVSTTFTIN